MCILVDHPCLLLFSPSHRWMMHRQTDAHLQQKNLCSFKVILHFWVQIVPFLHLLTKPILPEQGRVLYHKFMLIINIRYDPK